MNAPFFHHTCDKIPESEFARAVFWFKFWQPMLLYNPNHNVLNNLEWIMYRLDMACSKDCIMYFLEGRVVPDDLDSPEEYILYKLCNFFVKGKTIGKWSGGFRVDYKNWLASDDDHVFWITMKILNGFGDFNPYRLSNWGFWLTLCYLSQNHRSFEMFVRPIQCLKSKIVAKDVE